MDSGLLRYSTAAEVGAALAEIEAQPAGCRRSDMKLSFGRVEGRLTARERQDKAG